MGTEPEDPRTDQELEQEGGPIKSFLDHLEDLRWVLIKSLAATGLGLLICLIAGDHVVRILTWPLRHAKIRYAGTNQVWTVTWGTNRLGVFKLTDEQQLKNAIGTNRFVALKVDLLPNGTNGFLVALKEDVSADPAKAQVVN